MTKSQTLMNCVIAVYRVQCTNRVKLQNMEKKTLGLCYCAYFAFANKNYHYTINIRLTMPKKKWLIFITPLGSFIRSETKKNQ